MLQTVHDPRMLHEFSVRTKQQRDFIDVNADPAVVADLLRAYAEMVGDETRFKHAEGNSGAHALTSLVGPSVTLPIHDGRLSLGRWQAIYLCEFDGPRERSLQVQVLGALS